jgi:dTDP-4-dehydrorhamnose reductase
VSATPTILLTGADGQIGGRLRAALAPLGRVVPATRAELDVGDEGAVRSLVRALRPRVVVNAAAYTAVDRAEEEPEAAFRINADAPRVLAEEARECGALLVHFSTDYVFDGTKGEPYRESDPTRPLNVYGASKRAGEEAVEAAGGDHLVLRTSWVYDSRGRNFLLTMRRLMREREELRVVDDQRGAPTWARSVAEATARLAALRLEGVGSGGLLHLSAAGETSWHGFALAIRETDPRPEEIRCRAIRAVSSAEFPTPARRPAYSVLSNDRLAAEFGVRLPGWREQLRAASTEG